MWVLSLGWEDPLEEEIATHSSNFAWEILWAEEPEALQSTGSQRVGHDWVSTQHTVLKMMIKISLCLSYFKRVMFSYFEGLLLLLYVKGQIVEKGKPGGLQFRGREESHTT